MHWSRITFMINCLTISLFTDFGVCAVSDASWIKKLFPFLCSNCKVPSHIQGKNKISIFLQLLVRKNHIWTGQKCANIVIFIYYIQVLSETEEAQVIVLRSLFELWKTHQQMMVVLVDKMLKTQIVECSAVANWIFSKEMVSEFTKGYTWEMLHLTIR